MITLKCKSRSGGVQLPWALLYYHYPHPGSEGGAFLRETLQRRGCLFIPDRHITAASEGRTAQPWIHQTPSEVLHMISKRRETSPQPKCIFFSKFWEKVKGRVNYICSGVILGASEVERSERERERAEESEREVQEETNNTSPEAQE